MTKSLFLGLSLFVISSAASAALPEYKAPEILARANGPDSYNLPPMSFLNSTSATINNHGDVSFKLMAVEGENTQALWVNGKVVFRAPEGKVLTEPAMNDNGLVAVSVFEEASSDGIFVYDMKKDSVAHMLNSQNTDLIAHSYLQVLNSGEIFFRGTHLGQDHSFYSLSGNLKEIFSEGEDSLGFKASYLFGPIVNNQRQMATKIRIGNKMDWDSTFPDQILLLNADGSHRLVAVDQKSDSGSPYLGFSNSVSLSENGLVAFVGIIEGGIKTLVVDNHGQQTHFASEGQDGISEIELFAPQINSQGIVVFRAKNSKGLRGIYLADGQSVHRLIGEGDEIPTDRGPGRALYNPTSPGFGGNVHLNDRNEIVFYALVTSANGNHDWGSGVYKLCPL
jgi:hypothetical protein